MKEYIKFFWNHKSIEDPIVILYEIDTDNERLVTRSIDVFLDRSTNNIEDFYAEVLEIVPIPTIEELNNGIWGNGIHACLIDKKEFEDTWNSKSYNETITWLGGINYG